MPADNRLPETTTIKPVAYAYCRVSTVQQAKNGTSLDDQQEKTLGFYNFALKSQGVLWGDHYIDAGVSAAKNMMRDRESGRLMLERIRPGDHIIMSRLDRGFRNTADAVSMTDQWIKAGVHFHFLDLGISTTTHGGRLILRMFAAISEFQRDVVIENITAGKARVKAIRGTSNGIAKIGYKLVGYGNAQRHVPDEHARAIIMAAVKMRNDGLSCDEIAEEFRLRGVTAKKGRQWSAQMIRRHIATARNQLWDTTPARLPEKREVIMTGSRGRPAIVQKSTPRNTASVPIQPTPTLSSTPSVDFFSETQEMATITNSIATESSSTTARM